MPLPPIPFLPPSRDGDSLQGRHGLVGGRGPSPGRRVQVGGPEVADAGGDGPGATPAAISDASRGALPALQQVRDRAAHIGEGLGQLRDARSAVGTARTVLAHMSNVAVMAVDRGLQPTERAALQRQIDLAIGELVELADGTHLDESLLHGPAPGPDDGVPVAATPLRALKPSMLGVEDIGVRSVDQAASATRTLDVAVSRLDRTARALDRAMVRIDELLSRLVGPSEQPDRASGVPVSLTARASAAALRSSLLGDPVAALEAHPHGQVARLGSMIE